MISCGGDFVGYGVGYDSQEQTEFSNKSKVFLEERKWSKFLRAFDRGVINGCFHFCSWVIDSGFVCESDFHAKSWEGSSEFFWK